MAHNNKMIEWWYGFYISQLIRYSTDYALHSDFSGQSSAAEAKATQAKLRCVNVEVIVTKQFYCRLHISYFGGVRVAHRFCFLCCFLLLLLLLFGMSLFGVLLLFGMSLVVVLFLLLFGMSLVGVLFFVVVWYVFVRCIVVVVVRYVFVWCVVTNVSCFSELSIFNLPFGLL